MVRVGLYARVSTLDQQTLPMQNRALREYAERRGWTIAMQVKEVGSGSSQRQLREKLLEAARRREIDAVLVWRLDRWGRSVTDLLATLQELEHLGVGFVSLTEALDLTTPAGRAMAGLLAVFAGFEREIHFPVHAQCIASVSTSPLRKGDSVDIRKMAPEDSCSTNMLVMTRWNNRNIAVPLSQLKPIGVDESTQAIEDWHYWVAQGYCF